MKEVRTIQPQKGFQLDFLASKADIVIGGGGAGLGKSYALLIEVVRYINNPQFRGVLFRRTSPQIKASGGLWDTSVELYQNIAEPLESTSKWIFREGGVLKMTHLQHEKDKFDHQGSQYAFIGFDELTHFTEGQFFYLLSRNRSTSGIRPLIRATCNPDPDSWVANFIEWWIDQETGFPIPERNGKLRYFVRDGENVVWGDSREEVVERAPHIFNDKELKKMDIKDLVKSVTFIGGSIHDNKELLDVDPAYLGNLLSLPEEEKLRLLGGNWKIKPDDTCVYEFNRINDLFETEEPKECKNSSKYITCDVARHGRDLAVVFSWKDMFVNRIDIYTKSDIDYLAGEIEKIRLSQGVPKSNTLVDQDGVGGGVVDIGKYKGFSGGASVIKKKKDDNPEYYKNLKNQCIFSIANVVNDAECGITNTNIYVDGVKTNIVKIGKKSHNILELIKKDLRSFKRLDKLDAKKSIIPKEEQKILLNGRSPDFGDSFFMRYYFELNRKTYRESIFI